MDESRELVSAQPDTSNPTHHPTPGILNEILARLKDLEKRVPKENKIVEDASNLVGREVEDETVNLDERNDGEGKKKVKENDKIKEKIESRPLAPSEPSSEATPKTSIKLPKDTRYKYTRVNITPSGRVEEPLERPKLSVSEIKTSNRAVEYEIRYIKHEDMPERIEVIINNLGLKRLMWGIVRGWIQHCGSEKDWDNDEPLPLGLLVLFHHWDQLQALTKVSDEVIEKEESPRRSLQHLLGDIETIDSNEFMKFKGLRDLQMILYDSMQFLFVPGAYVVASPFLDLPQVFQVESHQYEKDVFSLTVWSYDWDGSTLLRRPYNFTIPEFDGEKRINELPIYPVQFFVDDTDVEGSTKTGFPVLRKRISPCAKLFRNFCKCQKGSQLFKYKGAALVLRTAAEIPWIPSESLRRDLLSVDRLIMSWKNVEEEIIIDPSSYASYGSDYAYLGERRKQKDVVPLNCKACDTPFRQTWIKLFPEVSCGNENTQESETFDDQYDHFMLLPSRVLGFLLGRKAWAQFLVDEIKPIDQKGANADIRSQLALPKGLDFRKLENMVKYHSDVVNATDRSSLKDPISGKGNGLVLLFHGPTGVGKTLTAEVLAKVAGMPLYKAGISEIGTESTQAEKGLRRLFELAQVWNAILLIDEADVFLDSRGSMGEADLEKNAMVAVLLREVEYFSGILIMTTNRVMTFDVAMLSRIHWPINLGYLSKEQEDNIWNIWRDKWKSQNEEVVKRSNGRLDQERVNDELNQYNLWRDNIQTDTQDASGLNGREIRNIFLGARTMANGDFVSWQFIRMCYLNIIRFRREMREKQLKTESGLIAGAQRR